MRRTTIILALLFALLGGGATFFAITRAAGAPLETARARIVVAAKPIPMGAALLPADFTMLQVREADAPSDAVRELADLRGKYALQPLAPTEPLRASRMSAQPPGSRLAQIIPDGHVAISVAVSDVISTGGQIAPGDHVDVLGVVSKEPEDTAQVVLRDVVVIAVSNAIAGAEATAAAGKSAPKTSTNPRGLDTTITLAVTINEAQRLVQVDETGKLRLALRRRADVTTAFR